MSRLRDQFNEKIVDEMMKKFEYKNKLQVPKLEKIVINMGVGEAKDNAKLLEAPSPQHSRNNAEAVMLFTFPVFLLTK